MPVVRVGVCPGVFDEVREEDIRDRPRHLTMLLFEALRQKRELYEMYWDFMQRPGAHKAVVERLYAGVLEMGDGLGASAGARGTGFWCLLAVVTGEQACFGVRRFEAFPEGSGWVLGDAGAGVDALVPGCQLGEPFGLLHFGRVAGHRPVATVFSLARRTRMTGLRLPDRADPEGGEVTGFAWLDRLDGWPTLKALWLGEGQGALLLVTADPVADLAWLRRWGLGAAFDDLEASLSRQAEALAAQGRMTWYLAHNQGRNVSLRQICLQNRFERRSLLPALELDGAGERQRQTRAVPMGLYPALVRVDRCHLVFDTFVWDEVRQESPLGYRSQDYPGCPRHRLCVEGTDFGVWVPEPDVTPPWVEVPEAFGPYRSRIRLTVPPFFFEIFDVEKDVRTPRFTWPRPPSVLELSAERQEENTRNQVAEDVAVRCYEATLLSAEESHDIHKTARLDPATGIVHIERLYGPRLLTRGALAEWLCRNAGRAHAPGIRHERIFLHLAFLVQVGDGALAGVREGVLSIRVPLEVAWHGLDLSVCCAGGDGLFLALCDTGLVLRVVRADGSVVVCRPDLDEVIPVEGGLTLRLGRLVGDGGVAATDPETPTPGCAPGPVTRLVVSGHSAGERLWRILGAAGDQKEAGDGDSTTGAKPT